MTRIPVTMDETFCGDTSHKSISIGGFMSINIDPDLGRVTINIDGVDGEHKITCTGITGIDCVVSFEVNK